VLGLPYKRASKLMRLTAKNQFLIAFSAIILATFLGTADANAAFGVSPPYVHADKLVKGAKFSQTVYLVRDIADADLPITGVLEVPSEIKDWVSVEPGVNFIIPAGTRQFPVKVNVNVPQDAPLVSYNGKLSFTSRPASEGQVTIALGAQVSIAITVGNDIYRSLKVPVVRVLDIEEGWNPQVFLKVNNEGNITEEFTGGTLEILDQYGAVRLAFLTTPKSVPKIPAFSVDESVVEFPSSFHLGLGQYWGVVNFYQGDTLVASQKTVFNVLKRGSLTKNIFKTAWTYIKQYKYYFGVGLILLVVVLGLVILRRKRKR
jgi:hypothetical protein